MGTETVTTDIGSVRIVNTSRPDGDFQVKCPAPDLEARRSEIVAAPWTWLDQVHSSDIVEVKSPGQHAGATADASYTRLAGCVLSATTADCAPVVLVASDGFAVIHAGWRGALAGIIQQTATKLLATGSRPLLAYVGPMISVGAYEFRPADLRPLVQRFGTEVAGETSEGNPALDMPRLVSIACSQAGFEPSTPPSCTSEADYFSYRTRGEAERMATVAWVDG